MSFLVNIRPDLGVIKRDGSPASIRTCRMFSEGMVRITMNIYRFILISALILEHKGKQIEIWGAILDDHDRSNYVYIQ